VNEEMILRGPVSLATEERRGKGGDIRQFVDPSELMLVGNKQ
jgi:hypothetical protein